MKQKTKKTLLFLTLFLFTQQSFSQGDYRFVNYSISNGLSQSSVTTIIEDELNTLWVGTQDGLNRFDGGSFEVFNPENTKGLESGYILCSHKDKDGNLWFGTSKGLLMYSVFFDKFQTYKKEGGAIQIKDITEDKEGHLWVVTAERGLFRFDKKQKEFKSFYFLVPSVHTTKIEFFRKNNIIVSTEDKGVFLCDIEKNTTRKTSDSKQKTKVNVIKKINKKGVFLGTNKGLFFLDKETNEIKNVFSKKETNEKVKNIKDVSFKEGVGWFLCTESEGLLVVNKKGEVSKNKEDVFQKTKILFNELNCIYKDGSGLFWVGSERGLSFFDPERKGFFGVGPSVNKKRGLPTPGVWCFEETKEHFFVGTDEAVSMQNKKTGVFRQFYRGLKTKTTGEKTVLTIKPITEKRILVGCVDGLFELTINPKKYVFKKIETSGFNRVYSIVHWKQSFFWIATKKGALLFDAKKQKTEAFFHDPKKEKETISKGVCRLVYKDLGGRIWFTTSTGGLNVLIEKQGKKKIVPYSENKKIKSVTTRYITSINNTKEGVYWFGTFGSGVLKWDEKQKKIKQYRKIDGLPNNVVYGVLTDKKKNLWFSTNKGVCVFNPKTEKTKKYTELDGLMSNEFNLGAYFLSKKGVIFFGGIYGYNYFNPEELSFFNKEDKIVFSSLKINGKTVLPKEKDSPLTKPLFLTKKIDLPYYQRSFSIKFHASNLGNNKKTIYKYILEGAGEGERVIGDLSELHFNSLSHGKYILKVFAGKKDGEWSPSPSVLKIEIAPPFWLGHWFLFGCFVLLLLLVWAFIKIKTETSRREQSRLEEKVKDRTKEIDLKNRKIEQQKDLLQKEKDKTEKLLKNVLPTTTAEELKKRGKARARSYKTVSVLFTDFVGFTKISDKTPASDLVKKLDVYFKRFDEIIIKNNLEKIKTIGDAYMCAGGVPVRNRTNPIDSCLAALQIQAYMRERKELSKKKKEQVWGLRLGINTGEVIAGVIGSERLAFDVWGSTVNHAQRMEMLGEPGEVTITGATHAFIEPYFECSFKGAAKTKSKGFVDMYVVERIKPELSIKMEGVFPNKKFKEIVDLHLYSQINYYQLEKFIIKKLKDLPKTLCYHNVSHTKDVLSAVERIALAENITNEGLFLLKSAAICHDVGFLERYEENEEISARFAQQTLPKYGYKEKHIKKIKELIFVTSIPQTPKTTLEKIICDADLDYLGRDDFEEVSSRLRDELKIVGKIKTNKEWDEIQVRFLKAHKYYTQTAKKTRGKKKKENLEKIINRIKEGAV